jgi:hypothetical protein
LRQIAIIGVEKREGSLGGKGVATMCDYSLQNLASRPAKVGDQLISTRFPHAITRGFAAADEPNVAVCLLPGTEVAFESAAEFDGLLPFLPNRRTSQTVARFRQINMEYRAAHHDALEFPGGKVVMVNALTEGQRLTVLQLPVLARLEAEIDANMPEPEPMPATEAQSAPTLAPAISRRQIYPAPVAVSDLPSSDRASR